MKKKLSVMMVVLLLLQVMGATGAVYGMPAPSAITCSAGTSSVAAGSTSGSVIDSDLTVSDVAGTELTGAKVYITTGFDALTDTLTFANTTSISGIYVPATGVLTLSGTAPVADYQAALRTVRLKTGLTQTGEKTVVFSLGDKLKFGSHYYEAVSASQIS